MRSLVALFSLVLALVAVAVAVPATAQDAASAPKPPIRVIIEVPNDEQGRAFVEKELAPLTAREPAAPAAPAAPPVAPAAGASDMPMSNMMATRLQQVRAKALSLLGAAPEVPDEIERAAGAFDMPGTEVDLLWLIAAAVLFAAGGFAAQRLVFWGFRGLLAYIIAAPAETVRQRLTIHAIRVSAALLLVVAFLVGSLGAFLLFPWPPLFREIVLVLLVAVLSTRLAVALGRIVLAPGGRHSHFRMLPMTTPLAWFWYRWLVWTTGLVMAGWGLVSILRIIGVRQAALDVVVSGWLALVAAALIVMVWRRQRREDGRAVSRLAALGLSVAIVLGWLLGSLGMMPAFVTLIVGVTLPVLIRTVNDGVRNIARLDDPDVPPDPGIIGWAVVVERALRAVLVIAGALIVARAFEVNLGDIAMGETALTRTIRAALRIVIVLLAADVVWKLARTLIDSRITPVATATEGHSYDDSPEARRRQRLNTLLPILRNVLMVVIAAVAILMALDSLGVQIGPLLAGAGVVGIAIGFGAQTLVRDVISGIFYLLDDAFRVGEYIQTSSHKGTVESFSLRSVKLRHHRGPITTVPFGELGAVQNLSRDWVIDKMTIGVTYDTDLDKVRKIVKQIGKELAADPELGPNILEPLKMQGVEQMAEIGVQIRLKMMTKPGEQFVVRRKAYAALKKAFEANGIKFAVPTVQVAGGGEAAAASSVIDRLEAQKAAPAPEAT